MKLYSILFTIIIIAGAVRFYGISLIDEAVFLLLVALLLMFRTNQKDNLKELFPNKYYKRATLSFICLFVYLIFSLLYGLSYDLYFGKARWLLILIAILLADTNFLIYLRKRFTQVDRYSYFKMVYSFIFIFATFYLFYGLIANYIFNISPGYIQAAQIDAWYAIWGTSAYVSIIFLPLLVFNKILRSNLYISRFKYISVYLLTLVCTFFYDSRVMAVMLFAFITAEYIKLTGLFKIIIGSTFVFLVSIYGAQADFGTWNSSGGFLISLLSDDPVKETLGDFDRIAHYIAAYELLSASTVQTLIGFGFLNAGKAIIPAYMSVYQEYGIPVAAITTNISGKQVATFGLSAFLIENGLVGLILLTIHLYNIFMVAIKNCLILPSIYVFMMYAVLMLIFFSIYINDNMLFYVLLSPSMFLYPLIKEASGKHRSIGK